MEEIKKGWKKKFTVYCLPGKKSHGSIKNFIKKNRQDY